MMADTSQYRKLRSVTIGLFICCGLLIGSLQSGAATNSNLLADNGKKPTPKTPIPLDRETETAALELVETQLPELNRVLNQLKKNKSGEYARAIRDLARSARKLEGAKKRDEHLYEIEAELLKAQTQVNLLTAKLKVRDNQRDRKQLRTAAGRLQNAQLSRAEYDVKMFQARFDRVKQQLESAEKRLRAKQDDSEELVEKSYLGMLRKAGREPEEQP